MTRFLLSLLCCVLLSCCATQHGQLTHISIVDRNGVTQTVNQSDRLKRFSQTDFLSTQPYEKIVRYYKPDRDGNTKSILTSYHENGQPMQYLEAKDSRASGAYREWYSNGQLRVEVNVVGGVADLTPEAQASWLFDGVSYAYAETGELEAEIPYQHGVLHGTSFYYHADGSVWKEIPYTQGKKHGNMRVHRADGTLLLQTPYTQDKAHGRAVRYWDETQLAIEELYENDRLVEGQYWSPSGDLAAEVKGGSGFRARFGRSGIASLHEVRKGVGEGLVKEFAEDGSVCRSYYIKDGEMHGPETVYFHKSETDQAELLPHMVINWEKGSIQGSVETWYPSGVRESAREFNKNQKHGLSTAWYSDGSLMLIEEYDTNRLVKGQYMRKGDKEAVSRIANGNGLATLFDGSGALVRRVNYANGHPCVEGNS